MLFLLGKKKSEPFNSTIVQIKIHWKYETLSYLPYLIQWSSQIFNETKLLKLLSVEVVVESRITLFLSTRNFIEMINH